MNSCASSLLSNRMRTKRPFPKPGSVTRKAPIPRPFKPFRRTAPTRGRKTDVTYGAALCNLVRQVFNLLYRRLSVGRF
jgi:hypothetical protein